MQFELEEACVARARHSWVLARSLARGNNLFFQTFRRAIQLSSSVECNTMVIQQHIYYQWVKSEKYFVRKSEVLVRS